MSRETKMTTVTTAQSFTSAASHLLPEVCSRANLGRCSSIVGARLSSLNAW